MTNEDGRSPSGPGSRASHEALRSSPKASIPNADWLEFYDDREEVWCDWCQGLGEIECDCGGDLCVCENYGTCDCPMCGGAGYTLEEPQP